MKISKRVISFLLCLVMLLSLSFVASAGPTAVTFSGLGTTEAGATFYNADFTDFVTQDAGIYMLSMKFNQMYYNSSTITLGYDNTKVRLLAYDGTGYSPVNTDPAVISQADTVLPALDSPNIANYFGSSIWKKGTLATYGNATQKPLLGTDGANSPITYSGPSLIYQKLNTAANFNMIEFTTTASSTINLAWRTDKADANTTVSTSTAPYNLTIPAAGLEIAKLRFEVFPGKTVNSSTFFIYDSTVSGYNTNNETGFKLKTLATATTPSTSPTTSLDKTAVSFAGVTEYTAPGGEPTTHSVTFVDWDGTTVLKAAQTVENGADAIPPVTDPTRDGYKFTGWSTYTNITADTTVTAQYRAVYVPVVETPVVEATDTSISLPTQDNSEFHRAIIWESQSPWISDGGDIIRPPHGSGDQQVTLKASITGEGTTDVIVNVPALDASQALGFTKKATTISLPGVTNVALSGIQDVALDSAGNFYVIDFYGSRVVKFDKTTGAAIAVYGTAAPVAFKQPAGIAIDEFDNIYVADTYNNRVVMFKDGNDNGKIDEGEFTAWGSLGGNDLQFKKPMGLTAKDGKVYVADTANNRVVRFSNVQNPVDWVVIGIAGNGDGEFKVPNDVAIDGNNNIWVSDTANKRVQMFKSSLAFRISYNIADANIASADAYPFGLSVDASGNVFAAVRWAGVVKCVNNTDVNNIAMYNGESARSNPFINPVGIVIKDGKVYVVDVTANKISFADIAG